MTQNTGLKILIPALAAIAGALAIFLFAAEAEDGGSNLKPAEGSTPFATHPQWNAYWNQGKAELSSFELSQARYGQVHQGKAVTIFVTENFSPTELTKADGLPGKSIPVLKVNFDKKFITGIYPYSMLMTVASPVDVGSYPHALKVATSSQEWCGHTYSQCNLHGNQYNWEEHSYFPGEGDQKGTIKGGYLEDELWTRIRISPENLPTGRHKLLPGTFYMRLRHQKFDMREADLQLRDIDAKTKGYLIQYVDGSRSLDIRFEREFPYKIVGWEETYEEGFGEGAKPMKTVATLINTIQLDYWSKNSPADTVWRRELGL